MFEDPNAGGGATSDPPVGTGGGEKSLPDEDEVTGFEESDPPVGTGGGEDDSTSDPPVGTGGGV